MPSISHVIRRFLLWSAILGGCLFAGSAVDRWMFGPPSIKPAEIKLSVDKDRFSPGERLNLRWDLVWWTPEGSIRLFNDPVRNFILWIKPLGPCQDSCTSAYESTRVEFGRSEGKRVVQPVFPEKKLSVELKASIKSGAREDELVFDFGRYGSFALPLAERYELSSLFVEADPHPVDSLEDYSNRVQIRLVR